MMFRLVLAAFLAATLSACGSDTLEPGDDTTINGSVTTDASSAKAPVEGAVVTAAAVSGSGSLSALGGTATTDAEGSFSLSTEATLDPVVLSASSTGFASRALLEAGAAVSSRVTAPPMTAETEAEADVFLAARARNSAVDVADAVYIVTADVAADIRSGSVATADVAAAVVAAVEAERETADDMEEGDPTPEARETRDEEYASFRVALAASGSSSGRATALARFEADYDEAYAEAGLSARARARVAAARAKAIVRFSRGFSSRTQVAVRRRARIAAAQATGLAVEAAFEAEGASSARIQALAAARAELVSSLEAAATESAMTAAEAEYAASVRAEISAETGASASQLNAAAQASASARTAFDAALTLATTGRAVATALGTFYAAVEAGAESAFGSSGSLAVEAFTLVSVY